MKSMKITVTGNQAVVTETAVPVSGTVGLPVEFTFDDAWEGLSKTAVFRANGKSIDRLDISEGTTVPWELLQTPGCRLWAGVYGTNTDGSLQIPTVWADLGVIQPGADPSGDESADPSLPVWEQVRGEAVLYTPQEKTESEKAQACKNIGAFGKAADGSVDMGGCSIRNLAAGIASTDAATVGQLNTAVGNIESALDNIINMQDFLMGKLITFNIDGSSETFYAEKEMEWDAWICSKYNTIGAYVDTYSDWGNIVVKHAVFHGCGDVLTLNGEIVTYAQWVIANALYEMSPKPVI